MRVEKVLVVDDDDELRRALTELLRRHGCTVLGMSSLQQGQEALVNDQFDLILADLVLKDGSGLDLLRAARKCCPQTRAILITGYATMETAVEAVRLGLFDYMLKPILPAQLDLVLRRAESVQQLESENIYLRDASTSSSDDIVWGDSPLMSEIHDLVRKVAQTQATVLIQGESGTGKEVVAHAIRQYSPRHSQPFVKVNCAAVPEQLLESEFFGHERGAFTGALQRREGRFETAHGGTLLLDEIAEIPLGLQAKLLRVLQERQFERVGGNKTVNVDVRIIASTNRDLLDEVRQGRFREDLYYRLNVVPVNLPPLRLRGSDLDRFVQFFLNQFARKHGKQIAGLHPTAWEKLRTYRWPGNVRELQNFLERAVILATPGEPIEATNFALPEARTMGLAPSPAANGHVGGGAPWLNGGELPTIDAMEQKLIAAALMQTRNNKTRAAQRLGISLRTLRNKLRTYRAAGVDVDRPEMWSGF